MPKIMLNSVEYTGGGGDNGMELTYDEYIALPEEEKTNGTTYYVKDINGVGKDQFQPIIYSEEEREIGVWTDGKPLYQKTAFVTPGNTISMVGLSLKYGQCYSINTSGGIASVPYNDGSYTVWWMSNDAIRFATQHNISQYVITYQYTKDSDQPGSGQWTPQGVPAVHYSTDEHVVGTWIDGSTIYERTVEIINSFSSSYPYDVSSFSNGILNFEGYYLCTTNKGTYRIPLNYYEDNTYHTYTGYNATTNKMFLKVYGFTGQKAILTIRYTKSSS